MNMTIKILGALQQSFSHWVINEKEIHTHRNYSRSLVFQGRTTPGEFIVKDQGQRIMFFDPDDILKD